MTTGTMRAVDRFVGVPLCLATGAWLRFFRRRGGTNGKHARGPAVFIKFFGIGSILRTAAAVRRYRQIHPRGRVVYVSFSHHREAVELIDGLQAGLYVDPSTPWSFLISTVRALVALRKMRPSVVFDFEFFSKFSTLISSLSGAPHRCGLDLPVSWRRWNLNHPYSDALAIGGLVSAPPGKSRPVVEKSSHVSELFLGMVYALEGDNTRGDRPDWAPQSLTALPALPRIPAIPGMPSVPAAAADGVTAGRSGLDLEILRRNGRAPARGAYVCVNVNAGPVFLERRWPRERFREAVVAIAASHPGLTFVFTGSAAERSYTQEAIPPSLSDRCVNSAGWYSLRQLAALFSGSELVISCDSGPLHLADLLGVPCIGIYGPETPAFYGVTGPASVRLYNPISCSPCMNLYDARSFRCPYNARCMDEISAAAVAGAAEALLGRRPAIEPSAATVTAPPVRH